MLKTNFQKGMLTILVGIVLWFLPVPEGLKPAAWHMFAIFVATIIGFILHPIPIGGVALIAVGLTGFLKVLKPAEALSGFGNATIWLIVGAYMFAKGFIKTGLGRRIAYVIMSQIATSSLKLGYSLAITDFIVSPATPSNTARGGGILYPIVRSLCTAFQSEPDDGTRKRIGNYLMLSTFECDCITSSLFLTSVAPNLLVAKLAKDVTGLDITWGTYALATILPGIIALIITPYLVYKLATPELTHTPEAPQLAKDELQKMGPMSGAETTVLIAFLAALAMWATTSFTGLNATMIALVCIGFMLVRGALEWNDIITEKGAWDTLVWMGGLMSLATGLAKLGFVKWIATGISGSLKGIDPMTTLLILCLINMYVHYAFASLSAHVSAVYAAFLAVAVAAGAPPMLSAIALGVETGIMGCLTHY
ncbi:MAG: DASS family sodium-coupled anion symporter, partial [Succiniclasticum sp.]|nr:DASS family sodium-coupled anion symporter [Succiniclasticum sp.]